MTLIILGCGYIGSRLARTALAAGRPVRVCARNTARLEPLAALGAEVVDLDAAKPKQFERAIRGTSGARVVYAVPPLSDFAMGEPVARATRAALDGGVGSFVYLGSSAIYGKRPDDDAVIDEDTPVAHDDGQMAVYHKEEAAMQNATLSGLRTVVLRMAAVYGPGRGVRMRLRKGDYQLVDDGVHWISRIHVDDVVQIVLACVDRGAAGSTYLVCDDRPTSQREYTEWLCARLGLPLPPSVPTYGAGTLNASGTVRAMRGRYISNARVKRELGLTLRYPSYVEGEAQVEAEEAAS